MSSEDELLEYLIKILEETEAGVGLTLCVNGLIIAGDMISSKKYFDKISTFYPSLTERGFPIMQQIKQFLQQKGKSGEERNNPKHIHLDNVVIYPSDPQQPFGVNLWRGKLSSVDGFSLGYGYWKTREVEDVSD